MIIIFMVIYLEKDNLKIDISKEDYLKKVNDTTEKSPIFKNIILAFIVGGLICCIGQGITNLCIYYNIPEKDSMMISTVALIFIGAFLTAINVYSKIGKYAGAGSIVPITGFSNSVVAPAIEFKSEGYILGLGSNMFKVAGPVLVYGILSSFIVGFFYYIITSLN